MNRRKLLMILGGAGAVGGGSYYIFFRSDDEGGPESSGGGIFSGDTYEVTFEILDENGETVEDDVTITVDEYEIDGRTIELEEGDYTLTVTAEGYEDEETTFTVEDPLDPSEYADDEDEEDDEDNEEEERDRSITETIVLTPVYEDVEGEWPEDDTDVPPGQHDLLSDVPQMTAYDRNEVTVEIPGQALKNEYRHGATLHVFLAPYGQSQGIRGVGQIESFEPPSVGTIERDISVSTGDFNDGVPLCFLINLEDSGTGEMEYICQSDPFTFEGNDALPATDINLGIDSQNEYDREARYRRAVGEGTYAIQLRGATVGTPWHVNMRVEKTRYYNATDGGLDTSDQTLTENVESTFGPESSDVFSHGFAETLDETEFTGEEKLRFFADVVRSLPDSPEPQTGFEEPINIAEKTFVEGGGTTADVALALAGLAKWQGYPAGVIAKGDGPDHFAAGVAPLESDVFSGYSLRSGGNDYYYLEPTRFPGGIGEASEDVRNMSGWVRVIEDFEEE